MMKRELPPFWKSMMDILSLEKHSRYLPPDVAAIVLKLLDIREEIFSTSAHRFSHNYTRYTAQYSTIFFWANTTCKSSVIMKLRLLSKRITLAKI